jgi:hypothetical protein
MTKCSNISFLCIPPHQAVWENSVRESFVKHPLLPSLLVLPVLQSVLSGGDQFYEAKAAIFVIS